MSGGPIPGTSFEYKGHMITAHPDDSRPGIAVATVVPGLDGAPVSGLEARGDTEAEAIRAVLALAKERIDAGSP